MGNYFLELYFPDYPRYIVAIQVGDTNLTNEIGENAGKIWKLLDSQGQANIYSITKSTNMKIKDVYSAIGWLSRENMVKIICKNKRVIYELT